MNFLQLLSRISIFALAYFAPVYEVLTIIMFFWLVDLALGIASSRRRAIPITSRRARQSVAKLIGYLTVVLLSFLIEKILASSWLLPHRFVAAYICTVELISIIENLTIITQNRVFISLLSLIRGQAAKHELINDLINEKSNTPKRPNPSELRSVPASDGAES